MNKVITPWHLPLGLKNNATNISKDSHDISKIGYFKKKKAKKAIRWLLSVAPHSVEEIADHFEMSPELVEGLLMELVKANFIENVPGHLNKYYLSKK